MNRSRSLFLSLSLLVLLPLASGVLWSSVTTARGDDGADSLYKYLSIFSEVFGLVRSSYVDPADADALLGGALEGVTDALDPFSAILSADALSDYERARSLARERSGLVLAKDRGIVFVVAVDEASPAAVAGVERGDLLAAIDGEETRGLPVWRVERRLAGEPGDELTLRLVRRGTPEERTLRLAVVAPLAPRVEEARGLPLLRIPRLESGVADQVRPLVEVLERTGRSRLLVDLREVAGGDAGEAAAVGALFARGPLGHLEERGQRRRELRSEAEPLWQGDMVVLVDGGTLGAAELLAAILRDGAGARLVGVRTFGWAGERSFVELSSGSRLHLTTAFYAGPDGHLISKGLTPEIAVDELSRRFDESERPLRELILERGIELLLGESAAARRAA
jgi:carboxyl-terminal processing protease